MPRRWQLATNKYVHLTVVLLFLLITSPLYDNLHPRIPIVGAVFLLTMVFTLAALGLSRRSMYIVMLAAAGVFFVQMALNNLYETTYAIIFSAVVYASYSAFIAICVYLMMRKILRSNHIDLDTIAGGINIYLLLGFLWSGLYHLIYLFDKQAFHFSAPVSATYFFYFSMTTLTTLGLGDVYPLNRVAMILASIEAMAGQLCLVVFISRLVGMHIAERRKD